METMEIKKIKTLVKPEWETERKVIKTDDYILGRISALNQVLSSNEIPFAFGVDKETGNSVFVGYFTEKNYYTFKVTIENWYPGLCEFYYEES